MYKALEKLAPAFQLYVLVSRPPDPLLVVLIKWLTTKTTSFWTRSSARLEAHFSISFPKDGMLFVSLLCLIVFQSLVLFVLWACIDVVYSRGDIDLIRELRKTLISLGQETEHGVEPKRIRVSFTLSFMEWRILLHHLDALVYTWDRRQQRIRHARWRLWESLSIHRLPPQRVHHKLHPNHFSRRMAEKQAKIPSNCHFIARYATSAIPDPVGTGEAGYKRRQSVVAEPLAQLGIQTIVCSVSCCSRSRSWRDPTTAWDGQRSSMAATFGMFPIFRCWVVPPSKKFVFFDSIFISRPELSFVGWERPATAPSFLQECPWEVFTPPWRLPVCPIPSESRPYWDLLRQFLCSPLYSLLWSLERVGSHEHASALEQAQTGCPIYRFWTQNWQRFLRPSGIRFCSIWWCSQRTSMTHSSWCPSSCPSQTSKTSLVPCVQTVSSLYDSSLLPHDHE